MSCNCDIKKLLTDGHEPWCDWKLFEKPKPATDTPAPRETPPLFSNPEEKWFLDVDLMSTDLQSDAVFWAQYVYAADKVEHARQHVRSQHHFYFRNEVDAVYLSTGGAILMLAPRLHGGLNCLVSIHNHVRQSFDLWLGIPSPLRKLLP